MLLKARADHIVLLNNDTVVTDGWLDQLLSLADSQASIGAVGPMSNYVSPPQLIPKPGYADMESMHAFAARWRVEHRGQWFTSPKLSGFCLLLKRYLLDEIGRLDESFGLGLFDDDDLCRRVVLAGYELAVAHDLFIHHYGSRTFIESGVDTARLLKENQALYASKWKNSSGGSGAGRHAAKLGRAPSQSVPPGSRQPCDDRT